MVLKICSQENYGLRNGSPGHFGLRKSTGLRNGSRRQYGQYGPRKIIEKSGPKILGGKNLGGHTKSYIGDDLRKNSGARQNYGAELTRSG